MDENLTKLRRFYDVKKIYRYNTVDSRKESVAEHSWSSLVLCDYFLSLSDLKLDKLKVYELLMYHDVVELISGDVVLHPNNDSQGQHNREMHALTQLAKELPSSFSSKVIALAKEFLEQKTLEAQFARAIEQLDAEFHEMDHPEDWDEWTEEFLRQKKEHLFKPFPELSHAFEQIVEYDRKEGFFKR